MVPDVFPFSFAAHSSKNKDEESLNQEGEGKPQAKADSRPEGERMVRPAGFSCHLPPSCWPGTEAGLWDALGQAAEVPIWHCPAPQPPRCQGQSHTAPSALPLDGVGKVRLEVIEHPLFSAKSHPKLDSISSSCLFYERTVVLGFGLRQQPQ